jgi:replication factor C small subunit
MRNNVKLNSEIPIWRVKYLPSNLKDTWGRKEIKERLSEFVNNQNFPHLLFIGSEKIGKTTLARLFAKEFLGSNYDANASVVYANQPLTSEELSQARSEAYVSTSKIGSIAGKRITTPPFIQIKVKPFVQLKVLGGAPFKILIVKDFDALGNNQQAFRRLMEIYGTNCRMILITTKVSRIIDPILSRCQIFLFSSMKYHDFKKEIKKIADNESLEIDDTNIKLIYNISEGKISHALDLIQISSISGSVDLNSLYDSVFSSQKGLIRSLLLMCFRGDYTKARDISRSIQSNLKLSTQELFKHLLEEISKLPLSNYTRTKIINFIAEADFRAIDGRDIDIQISNLIAKICHLSEYM